VLPGHRIFYVSNCCHNDNQYHEDHEDFEMVFNVFSPATDLSAVLKLDLLVFQIIHGKADPKKWTNLFTFKILKRSIVFWAT